MTTIYMPLLNEGTNCWRPVHAVHIAGNLYQITGEVPGDEEWTFAPGTIVYCDLRTFSDGAAALTAISAGS